jgi:hypothetical protein
MALAQSALPGSEPAMQTRTPEPHVAPPPLPIPATVRVREAVPYVTGAAADPVWQVLDLYLPKKARQFPTVVFVHGGGYQRGDRTEGHNLGVVLANRNVAVASISYRLYPAARHPAQIEDVAAAFAWVKSHIARYGGDPSRVYVSGHSAGGHLAALLGTDATYLAAEGLRPQDVAGVLAISGGYRINPIRKEVFGDEAGMAAASPFAHISGGHPPSIKRVSRCAACGPRRSAMCRDTGAGSSGFDGSRRGRRSDRRSALALRRRGPEVRRPASHVTRSAVGRPLQGGQRRYRRGHRVHDESRERVDAHFDPNKRYAYDLFRPQ